MMLLDEEDLKEDKPIDPETSEPEAEGEVEQKVDQPTETQTPTTAEDEGTKVLDFINKKGIKFKGEKVTVDSIENLINTYQKGLNYDIHEADDQDALDYIRGKASELGISQRDYMARVREYEKDQAKEAADNEMRKLVSRGIDEETARRIVNVELAQKQLEKEKAELQKMREAEAAKEKENKEYEEFLTNHADIKAEDIPTEVFEAAKTLGLNAAYNQYENKVLKEKLKQMEQAIQNASSSPVGLTSNGSSTEQESKDAFFEGFDSE